jgi:hypothetical protein
MATFKFLVLALAMAVGVSARYCQNLTVTLSLSARNGQFNLDAPTSNIEVTNFILNSAQTGHNYTEDILEDVSSTVDNSLGVTESKPWAV